ncbi:GtrA family protein, partial [Mesorhizobium intechi]
MSDADQPRRSTGSKIVRFAIVGLANTAIDLAGFFLLLNLHVPPLPANVISWSVAVIFSFAANGFWSFERNQAIRLHDAFLRFVSLGALISLGVSSLSIALFASVAGVWPAKIGGVIVAA